MEKEHRAGAKGQEVERRDFKKMVKMSVTKLKRGRFELLKSGLGREVLPKKFMESN